MILLYFMLLIFTLDAEVVEKRGFIIRDESGDAYLSDTPGVKSCCVKKKADKIKLVGDFGALPEYSAITLKGDFIPDSEGGKLFSEQVAQRDGLSQK